MEGVGIEVSTTRCGQGEGIAHCQHGRRACGGCELQRARLGHVAEGQVGLAKPPEGAVSITADPDARHFVGPKNRGECDDLFGLAAVGEKECDVSTANPSQITMDRFGWMKDVGGPAKARERGRDLRADQS